VTAVSLPTPSSAEQPRTDGPLLAVQGLFVTAGGATDRTRRTLVRDLSFSIEPGKTLALVGESGSGKSMTARAILGLLPQNVRSTGSVRLADFEIVGARERELRRLRGARLSLLLQDPFTMLNPLQSAFDTVAESLPRSLRRDRRLARDEVERRLLEVGVDPALAGRRYPFQLSGGMRQRVALAAALAKDPQVLIADEPTTALDVTTQRDILELLAQLQRTRGMSLLLITHDLAVAFSVCDQVLVLYAGSMLEYGPSAVLAEQPAHPYTAKLRASSPPATHFVERLEAIPGTVPAADAVANQCAFAERCDWARPVCFSTYAIARPVAEGHASACIRVDEIRGELSRSREWAGAGQAAAESPTAASAVLEVDELRKSYRTVSLVGKSRKVEAVRGVSFRIDAGESLGLVGESGSGKTSIARCILGLSAAEAGRIRLEGTDITDYGALSRRQLAQVRASVQMVFQDPYASLNPRLTIGSALAEAIRASRLERVEATTEVAALLQLVGLPEHYASRRPRALSGGERQRVAIARALAIQPQLLVCDEPVASLDVSVQAQILELLRDIRRQRATSMLFITHDLAVVRQMTERVIVLYDGQIVEAGPTADVLDAPTHPYTQRLLASRVD
jgi:oligopeptide/dipeptide ABC transporter ATP-binding protein